MGSPLADLRTLLDAATPRPWFNVGPPWNTAAPWINAGSEDPHGGSMVCDFFFAGEDGRPDNAFADAALIVAAVNMLPALLDCFKALERYTSDHADEGPCGCVACDALAALREQA